MTSAPLCQCGCGEPAPVVKQAVPARGLSAGDFFPFRRGHYHRKTVAPDCGYIVDEETGCWVWQLALDEKGYARRTRDRKSRYAYRLLYEERYGPVPDGLQLDHLCRNRRCVNPDHLEPVTRAENIRRCALAKLTHADVAEIRASSLPLAPLAAQYGVSKSTICRARRYQSWVGI